MQSVSASKARMRRAFMHDIVLRLNRVVSAAQQLRNIKSIRDISANVHTAASSATYTCIQRLIANMSNQVC